jgi:hypothetical protein
MDGAQRHSVVNPFEGQTPAAKSRGRFFWRGVRTWHLLSKLALTSMNVA